MMDKVAQNPVQKLPDVAPVDPKPAEGFQPQTGLLQVTPRGEMFFTARHSEAFDVVATGNAKPVLRDLAAGLYNVEVSARPYVREQGATGVELDKVTVTGQPVEHAARLQGQLYTAPTFTTDDGTTYRALPQTDRVKQRLTDLHEGGELALLVGTPTGKVDDTGLPEFAVWQVDYAIHYGEPTGPTQNPYTQEGAAPAASEPVKADGPVFKPHQRMG